MWQIFGVPYYGSGRNNEEEPWYTRDADAAMQLVEAIRSATKGNCLYQYNILNKIDARASSRAIRLSRWRQADFGVCATRPPFSDGDEEVKTAKNVPQVEKRKTPIEEEMFKSIGEVWERLSRCETILDSDALDDLGSIGLAWRALDFKKLDRAELVSPATASKNLGIPCSVGYLYFVPILSNKVRCPFLFGFSHSGFETLTWCHIIRKRFVDSLRESISTGQPRLIVACFKVAESDLVDISKLKGQPLEVVIDVIRTAEGWKSALPVAKYKKPEEISF